jgi:hypothetical protein
VYRSRVPATTDLWIMAILLPRGAADVTSAIARVKDPINHQAGYWLRNVAAYVQATGTSFGGTMKGLNMWETNAADAFATNAKGGMWFNSLGGHLHHFAGWWYSYNLWA